MKGEISRTGVFRALLARRFRWRFDRIPRWDSHHYPAHSFAPSNLEGGFESTGKIDYMARGRYMAGIYIHIYTRSTFSIASSDVSGVRFRTLRCMPTTRF